MGCSHCDYMFAEMNTAAEVRERVGSKPTLVRSTQGNHRTTMGALKWTRTTAVFSLTLLQENVLR